MQWFLAGSDNLSLPARDAVADMDNEVRVSAVSALEISTKYRIGKLPGAALLALDFAAQIEAAGFAPLPVGIEAARLAGSFRRPLRDPFDRLLIAQALTEDFVLVSNEKTFDDFGVKRLW